MTYRRIVNNRISKEEKVAVTIGKLLTDLYLDLESVGYYIFKANPHMIYRRFEQVAESAKYEREGENND